MKKILVISDNHSDTSVFNKINNISADLKIHLGDSELNYNNELLKDFIKIKGNKDEDINFLETKVLEVENYKIFLTHGHLFNVEHTKQELVNKAKENNCSIVLYGHTHEYKKEEIQEIKVVNPGSSSFPRVNNEKTYLIINIDDKIDFKLFDIESQKEIKFK